MERRLSTAPTPRSSPGDTRPTPDATHTRAGRALRRWSLNVATFSRVPMLSVVALRGGK